MNIQISRNKSLEWQTDVLLAPYSTYKIGGRAKLFTKVSSKENLIDALKYCSENNLYYYLLGKGSNTIFDDRGFDGAVILNGLSGFNQRGEIFDILSGTSLSLFAIQSAKLGYGGLEYAAGIPGSIGGAIFMNAGANGQEMSILVESVEYINANGEVETFLKDEILFDYRWSSFHDLKGFILSGSLKLYKDQNARERQIDLIKKRKLSQPLTEPSCGCIFRNGKDFITGKIIDELGLKGAQVGGAQISKVHGNFIVNVGHAKAQDVKDLVQMVEEKVFEKTQQRLEREVRYVPYQRS